MLMTHADDTCWIVDDTCQGTQANDTRTCWRFMLMTHADDTCWRYMHADDTGWWYMLMTHEKMTDANNDTWRWDMPISHGIKTSLLESVNLGVLRFYRPKSIL